MKFEEKLEASMRRKWEEHYLDYRGLKKVIKLIERRAEAEAETGSSSSVTGVLREALLPRDALGPDIEFLTACRLQYQKVQAFYHEELEREAAALLMLLPQLQSASPAITRRASKEQLKKDAKLKKAKDNKENKSSRMRGRERASCMRASVELFRNLQHLTNFCILNYTGFVKICKKHDKSVAPSRRLWSSCLEAELEPLPFVVMQGLDSLVKQLEQGYADAFCEGNLQMAKASLLMRQETSAPGMALTLGLQLGACAMLVVWTLWDLWVDAHILSIAQLLNTSRQWKLLSLMLPIYRACGAIVLSTGLWAGCLQCWKVARINYLFMFDLDPDSALSPASALVMATRLCVVFLLSVLLFVKALLKELPHWLCTAPGIFPASMLLAMVGELLLPPSRFRFAVRSLGRVLLAPLYSVDLWTSFVGDVLTSLVKPTTDMAYSLCYLLHGEWLLVYHQQGGCADWWVFNAVIKPLLCALPLWCRFMQALRVYHDTHKRWPALGNASKYAIAHLVVLFGALHNPMDLAAEGAELVRYAWITAYLISTLYTFCWDVAIDWRLGSAAHSGLRERRMFSRDWVYHLAIGADLVLRFAWTATLVPGSQSVGYLLDDGQWLEILSNAGIACAEMCRRAMWAVLRLEAEHLHNTEGLRRVAVIPLHFDPKRESNEAATAAPVRRCGVLVELLAYAAIVGVLALLAALTRPRSSVASVA